MHTRAAFAASAFALALLAFLGARAEDAKPAGAETPAAAPAPATEKPLPAEKLPPPASFECSQPEVDALPPEPTAEDTREFSMRTRLRLLECELERRRYMKLDLEPYCFFGPVQAHMTAKRHAEIVAAHRDDTVELWHALLSEPEDPNAPPIELRVRSKSGTTCEPDYDRMLEIEAGALRKELNFR